MATQTIVAGTATFAAAQAGDNIYVLGGGQTISGNVDYSGVNTSVILEVSKAFTGQIGTSAAPFQTAFSTRLVYMASAGDLWFESDAADTDVTALVYHLGGGHLHFINTGTATRFEQASGQFTLGNAPTLTTYRMAGGQSTLGDTGTGPAITLFQQTGGHCHNQRPCTTYTGTGGTCVFDADSAGGVNAQGTVQVFGANVSLKDVGTITALTWLSGNVDASQLSRPLTITDATIAMHLPGAQALLDHPLITYTNTPVRVFSDGRPL